MTIRKVASAALLIALLGGGMWWWGQERRPNVLLITLDSVRPDFLSCYGGTHAPTPNIDALAAGGVLFAHAVCDVPLTRSSAASLMTSRYPTRHGVRAPFDRLPLGAATMAERFRAAGYRTGAVVATFHLDHIFQVDQGFDRYDDRFDSPLIGSTKRPLHVASVFYGDRKQDRALRRWKLYSDSMRGDKQVSDAAIGWLRYRGRKPFFLWVHYFAGHERRTEGADTAALVTQYQPGVLSADAQIGRLLGALADMHLDRSTLVVLHADHGQSLLEHGGFGHGVDLYEQSVRVPLIMRWPGRLPAGRRVAELTRVVDIFPTVAELAGLGVPPGADGRSLAALVGGQAQGTAVDAYFETYGPALLVTSISVTGADGNPVRFGFVRRAVLSNGWKFIRSEPSGLVDVDFSTDVSEPIRQSFTTEELYDLEHDPQEQNNLISQEPARSAELRQRIAQHVAALP